MPLLGTLIASLFGGLANFLADFVGKKIAVALAYVAALGSIVTVLLVFMRGVVEPLAGALFSYPWAGWMGLAFPPVVGTCIAALAGTWAACVLYRWQRAALGVAASV